jgi:hypothetical protein
VATKQKPPAVLDAMLEHVRYELDQTLAFLRYGNGWCQVLHPSLGELTQNSLLEAALIHFRCLVEFLGGDQAGDRVVARDYLNDWDWKITEQLGRVGDLHGRLGAPRHHPNFGCN